MIPYAEFALNQLLDAGQGPAVGGKACLPGAPAQSPHQLLALVGREFGGSARRGPRAQLPQAAGEQLLLPLTHGRATHAQRTRDFGLGQPPRAEQTAPLQAPFFHLPTRQMSRLPYHAHIVNEFS